MAGSFFVGSKEKGAPEGRPFTTGWRAVYFLGPGGSTRVLPASEAPERESSAAV
jgi:hypothetical protein